MKIQWRHEFQKKRRRSIPLRIIHALECFLRVMKGHRSRISMRSVFAWYKWRNCTQSRLVLAKVYAYTIAVFLLQTYTLNERQYIMANSEACTANPIHCTADTHKIHQYTSYVKFSALTVIIWLLWRMFVFCA